MFVKCQPPSLTICRLIFLISENIVSSLQKEYFLFFKFLKLENVVNFFFYMPLILTKDTNHKKN